MATKSTSNSKIITCKGAVVWGKGEGVKVEEIQVDPPKSSEVRVKMLFASLCHTDLLCCNGHPLVMESVGEGVTEVKEGDTVMPTYIGECGECANCSSSVTNSNLCLTHPLPFDGLMPDGTSRLSKSTTTTTTAAAAAAGDPDQKQMIRIYHHFTCSTWCEYIVIDVHYVVKLDPRIPLPHASFLSCGYSTGFGATFKQVVILRTPPSLSLVLLLLDLG
ncbi:8-hydroxygeraniol oxidoreductase [Camellia lanceoleosa]|uniref:8-hydroxygeraniol oxidoreductase n=1 Tax=Camellia lanceoleosa TaxID=1840588 RepID=A0ACC0H4X6_9ERIC|nr:8-hydroxygeraniol oxidoreductase [Camellia lanceoleosa]